MGSMGQAAPRGRGGPVVKPCQVTFGPRTAPCPNEATTQHDGVPACDVCRDEKQQGEIDDERREGW